ncbi:hypothetical protein G7054_g14234 [Neopestalotiopsis clavispora]|nr:hypothetical protein G7054_g14234 [Neopestalotiopsis clavispora]
MTRSKETVHGRKPVRHVTPADRDPNLAKFDVYTALAHYRCKSNRNVPVRQTDTSMTRKGATPIAFRRKPISGRVPVRNKQSQWKPKGIFRFLDLPAELRHLILEYLVEDSRASHRHVVGLLSACRQLYRETAELCYRNVTEIPCANYPDKPCRNLVARTYTDYMQRLYIRHLTIEFDLVWHMHNFQSRYAASFQDMVTRGKLTHLTLEIQGRPFPSSHFWGGRDADGDHGGDGPDGVELVPAGTSSSSRRKGQQPPIVVMAPRWVAGSGFQSFLQFLREATVPEIRLLVDAYNHHAFWCPFHRQHSNKRVACDGEWKGKQRRTLRVDWAQAVKALQGLRLADRSLQELPNASNSLRR